jgi:hypothetical protein
MAFGLEKGNGGQMCTIQDRPKTTPRSVLAQADVARALAEDVGAAT